MPGSPLAIDIETVGLDWDEFEIPLQEYLLGRAKTDEERDAIPGRLALHPGTGRIIAIGMWRPYEDRGGILIEGEDGQWADYPIDDGTAALYRGSESQILSEFWRVVSSPDAGQIITYNGRAFDAPYLMIRSAMLGVAPKRNLMPNRYHLRDHCDLAEVLSFFRSRPMDSFDFWCRRFGVPSPKETVHGGQVGQLYAGGRLDVIARYCLEDARAAGRLYKKIEPLLSVLGGQWRRDHE